MNQEEKTDIKKQAKINMIGPEVTHSINIASYSKLFNFLVTI